MEALGASVSATALTVHLVDDGGTENGKPFLNSLTAESSPGHPQPPLRSLKLIMPDLAEVVPLPVNEDFEGVA